MTSRALAFLWLLATALLLSACSGEEEDAGAKQEAERPAPEVPALPEGSDAYLDFWWTKGTNQSRHHLILLRANAEAEKTVMAYGHFEIPKSEEGWRELFRPPAGETTGVYVSLRQDPGNPVYAGAREEMRRRVNEELGGLAKHQLTVRESLTLGERLADVFIVGSALVAFPKEMEQARRDEVLYAVVFARAAALAAEDKDDVPGTYEDQFREVLIRTGWSGTSAPLALEPKSLLIDNVGTLSKTAGFLKALGLMKADAQQQ